MLGRTANGLYWMFRFIERAENTARLIDAGSRMSLTSMQGSDEEWASVLQSAGVHAAYMAAHDQVTAAEAVNYLLRDKSNPSSVASAIELARSNGRMVRTALTREAWEATNECYLSAKALLKRQVAPASLPQVLDQIKRQCSLIRGTFHGTMLRNEVYNFARIGTFIERADSTARILDVKYYVLLPASSYIGTTIDNVQWESILRSVSAHRSYTWAYDPDYNPVNIADFLILNDCMPRSLAYCHDKIVNNLAILERLYGQRHPAHDTAEAIKAMLEEGDIQQIVSSGLHEFLEDFLGQNNRLGHEISQAYQFYPG
ncbi:alpha-E domain-containing protein [Pseudohoeflea coraliihabitans]|uniref:Alpha-E domain-containing protein n=1 Tax=Pseudohoeflea coraliihabitans TaxID=2860393 RepID=A0ABS6WMX6_9HYPH|nr:alpha-E domain-containing protein [Pseudohoeflea sp. DP4N28-3]MBW3097008.1 alpha-E domain-containing protein [Pseudohoeflea sp. DP4N28-3]